MSNFLEVLRERRRRPSAVVQKFRLMHRSDRGDTSAFMEGTDDVDYYSPAIRMYQPIDGELHVFVCDGKDRVIEVRDKLMEETRSGYKLLFFVDRDLEDLIGDHRSNGNQTFVTDGYSIENYVCNEEFFGIFLRDFLKIGDWNVDDGAIVTDFSFALESFISAMLPIMKICVVLKDKGLKANFNNVDLSKILESTPSLKMSRRASSGSIFIVGSCASFVPITLGEYRNAHRRISSIESRKIVRGKFLLWFTVKYMNFQWVRLANATKDAGRRIKVDITLTVDNFFRMFSGRWSYSDDLKLFLQSC